ncbi:MAG: hypothetical protein J6B26_01420 [Agathobacter sp.]|nr:hypothetical protein [Agathobacter sp.]
MSIRPVILNGMIQRTDDVGHLKQNEAQKPVVDQQNIQQVVHKKEEAAAKTVLDPNKSEQLKNQADAKEGGKGFYFKQNSSKKKKSAQDGGTVVKKQSENHGFDMKV